MACLASRSNNCNGPMFISSAGAPKINGRNRPRSFSLATISVLSATPLQRCQATQTLKLLFNALCLCSFASRFIITAVCRCVNWCSQIYHPKTQAYKPLPVKLRCDAVGVSSAVQKEKVIEDWCPDLLSPQGSFSQYSMLDHRLM